MSILLRIHEKFEEEGAIPVLALGIRPDGARRVGMNCGLRKLVQDPGFRDQILETLAAALKDLAEKPLDDMELI